MTTNIETQIPLPNILTKTSAEVVQLTNVSADEFATLMVQAPYKADLAAAESVKQWLYKKDGGMIAAATEALEQMHDVEADIETAMAAERLAMLYGILGSAYRRKSDFDEAKAALDQARELLPTIANTDTAWAVRIRGLVEYEYSQVLRPLGEYMQAAQINFKNAGKEFRANRRLNGLLEQRLGALNMFDEALRMEEDSMEPAEVNAAMAALFRSILDQIQIEIETSGGDKKTETLIELDRIRIDWLTGEECDHANMLLAIRIHLDRDETLWNSFIWSYRVMWAANAVMAGDQDRYDLGLAAANLIIADAKIGNEWRAEAMLAAAQISLRIGNVADAGMYAKMITNLPNYIGPAAAKATTIIQRIKNRTEKGESA